MEHIQILIIIYKKYIHILENKLIKANANIVPSPLYRAFFDGFLINTGPFTASLKNNPSNEKAMLKIKKAVSLKLQFVFL